MKKKLLSGILFSSAGSLWWGVIGVFYFKYVSFAGTVELVVHRSIWTAFILFLSIIFYSRWDFFFEILNNKKKLFILFISGLLIFINWFTWIYAVVTNRLVDASFGYYIFPILSVLFGFIFFKEKLNKKRIISIFLVLISIIYLLFNFKSIPWIGLTVAITWSTYNLLRKKINVQTDIGLFIETIFFVPVALILFYFISQKGLNDFSLSNPNIMFWLFLAGPMTVIPLYLYLRGVELAGLGTSGMVFFITPTGQFLLGIFYYNEIFNVHKLIGFIFIWIAVIIYLKDLNQSK
jgi:chloramphenicol-sensitive protein RarD